jgi:hypothetical protein
MVFIKVKDFRKNKILVCEGFRYDKSMDFIKIYKDSNRIFPVMASA